MTDQYGRWLSAALMAILLGLGSAAASAETLIRYQGTAVDAQGVPLNGPYTLIVRFYPTATGGSPLWQETHSNVSVTKGHFSLLLGAGGPAQSLDGVDWAQPLWLGVQVNSEPELAPRQPITSVPKAVVAERLISPAPAIPTGAIVLWDGAACPAGYSRVSTMDGKFLVSGNAHNPAAGGYNTHNHSGNTDSHTLTVAEMPSHIHTSVFRNANGWAGNTNYVQPSNENTSSAGTHTSDPSGGGQGHSHAIGAADNRPEFATVLLCKKS